MTGAAPERTLDANAAGEGDVIEVEVIAVGDHEEGGTGTNPPVPPAGDAATQPAEASGARDEYLDLLQRTQADFANYRKRAERQRDEAAVDGAAGVIRDLVVPVLDALDAGAVADPGAVGPVRRAALDAAERAGLERLDPTGEAFDPAVHEGVAEAEADGSSESQSGPGSGDTVRAVYRAGYRWRGRLVRPAQVEVAKG